MTNLGTEVLGGMRPVLVFLVPGTFSSQKFVLLYPFYAFLGLLIFLFASLVVSVCTPPTK